MKIKISCLLTALVVFIGLFSVVSFAEENQYLHIIYEDNEYPLSEVQFSLYYLGRYENGILDPDDAFDSYQCDYSIDSAEERKSLALTLEAYAMRDNIKPLYESKTNENGFTDFEGALLAGGVYLLTGEKHFQYDKYYEAQPVIILLSLGETNTVVMNPKYESDDKTDGGVTSVRVIKAWQNDSENNRPSEIEVQLLKDGEIYDTVKLNAEKSWEHTWTNLDKMSHWRVAEKDVDDNYNVRISLTDTTFLITNIKESDEEESTKPDSEKYPEIPETGMLMWPVPYLALAGLLIFIIGFVYYRKSEMKNDTKE